MEMSLLLQVIDSGTQDSRKKNINEKSELHKKRNEKFQSS